jgi:hypothetical protein
VLDEGAMSRLAIAALVTLLGATSAAALPFLVNRGLGTCGGTPLAAAIEATNNGIPDDPVGNDDCFALCTKWVTACKGAVDASVACWRSTIAKYASLQSAICNTQSGIDKETCLDTLSAEKSVANKDYADAGRQRGREYCATTGLFSCNISCN